MAEDPWWDAADPRRGERIVVALRDDRDRELLADWLESVSQYGIEAVSTPEEVPDEYDLCIVDDRAREAFAGTLRDHERASSSVYLPHMLLVRGDDGHGERRVAEFDDLVFDDVVSMPVDRPTLRRRIENLLRARRASQHLREREKQYRELIERTPEAIVLVSDGTVAYANGAACELLDVGSDDVVGERIESFVEDDDREALRHLIEDVAASDETAEFVEMTLESTTGAAILAEVTGVTVTYEGREVTQLVVRDLTEHKRRKRQLTLFGRAIEAASQGITIADAQQDDEPLVYANSAFERITGYPVDEVLGGNCRFLQGENTAEEPVAQMHEAIAERRPVSVELVNYRRDGGQFWNWVDIVPVRDESGTVTHFLGLQRDVTERKEREQRLAVLDRVLRHNLRNRMTVIRGNAEQLLEETDSDAARRILDASDELLNISDQVRMFRGTIAPAAENFETVDLPALVDEVVASLRERRPDIDVTLDLPGTGEVRAHKTLAHGIENLLTLAASDQNCAFEVRVREDGERVTMEVIDRSRSISVDALEVVRSGTETPLAHAKGLELWLIRWAVEQSRGEFSVEVRDDASVVELSFPLAGSDSGDEP